MDVVEVPGESMPTVCAAWWCASHPNASLMPPAPVKYSVFASSSLACTERDPVRLTEEPTVMVVENVGDSGGSTKE